MIIRMNTDQLKRIRDDAFECAAQVVKENCENSINNEALVSLIRAMKDSPISVLVRTVKDV